ncbi:amino acid adenylation domain-containing protein [Aquimarina sp. TRL1]|uniref:amino acid adenylation domain-containing protein n=1 Tax=Aquimarina sp. (strain TRL1) TaxID=2736252 RepID=UPI00158B9BF5|nr:non-ribosomal peptide synthetase [Aquimarina sp. TRL1]QKX03653.1 amino acid adenylation domain-containing protein [Aquimarina sp. TRL1]
MEFFIKKLKELNLFLVEKEGKLVLKGLQGKLTKEETEKVKKNKEIIEFIRDNKPGLIEHLRNEAKKQVFYKLSPLQEGLLFHGLYDPDSSSYTIQFEFDFTKKVDVEVLKKSWEYVISRHSILRTAFFYEEISLPVQRVYESIELPFTEIDLSSFSREEKEERVAHFMEEDYTRGFSFNEAPLIRIALLKLDETTYKMVFTNHHIIMDGWSLPILINELLYAYNCYIVGNTPEDVAEDSYEDYIKYIANKDTKVEENFWRTYLEGVEAPTLLPFSKTETSGNKITGEFKESSLVVDKNVTQKLIDFSKRYRLTPNTILQGVWAFLLSKYTGYTDVKFGVTVSGRPAEIGNPEQRVGLYINTLPLRTILGEKEHIVDWLETIQGNHTSCREYQYINLAKIQEFTGVKEDLFDTLFVFENFPITDTSEGKDVHLTIDSVDGKEQTNYPITISITLNEELDVKFSYNTALLEDTVIEMIQGHFGTVLEQMLAAPNGALSSINVLTEKENAQILYDFNDTEVCYPLDKTVTQIFKEQVNKNPDAIAVVYHDKKISYKELDVQSDQVAAQLQAEGVVKDTLVGICLERTSEMVIGILGILKAGAAYVPMKPDYPNSRLAYILEEITAKVVITDRSSKEIITAARNVTPLVLDEFLASTEATTEVTYTPYATPSSLAYIIYTSGSTGTPKGAMIEHKGLLNHLLIMVDEFKMNEETVMAFTAPFTFDISVWQILSPLVCGGQVIVYNEEMILEPANLLSSLVEEKVNLLQLVPSYLDSLLTIDQEQSLNNLQYFLVTGEAVQKALLDRWFNTYPAIPVANAYGPTEAADDVSFYFMHASPETVSVPIGKPVANMKMYVVDNWGHLAPIGVGGEICVAGVGVGRGYLNDHEKTNKSFVKNPFSDVFGDRLYKTGDLGCWLADGNLEYQGRKDDQVKIRGHRIELGEIDSVLSEHPSVTTCCVLAKRDTSNNNRLVAYVVTKEALQKEVLQEHLGGKLPEYMVPSVWVSLEKMPLTANGKIDKKSLPDPENKEVDEATYIAPVSSLEKQLAGIWQELLKLDKVGVQDNFFEIGGHSLLATRLVSMIRKAIDTEIAIKDIFAHPTIVLQCQFIEGTTQNITIPAPTPQERDGVIPLSFSQERLWFLDTLQGSREYHMPGIFHIEGVLNIDVLEKSFKAIVEKHDILRTTIKSQEGIGYQDILDSDNWLMSREIVTDESHLEEAIATFIDMPFDLAKDYMIRVCLYTLKDSNKYVLALVMHHISSDGWSDGILFDELVNNYKYLTAEQELPVEKMSFRYADYAIWQRNYLSGDVLEQQLAYWETQLQEVPSLSLPTDYPRPAQQTTEGSSITYELNEEVSKRLAEVGKQEGATLFMTLLTAFKVLLYRYSGQEDICVGTPIANRPYQELENLIGFFVNTLALRTTVNGDVSFIEVLKRVKEVTLGAYQHQMVPFEKVVDKVTTTRDMSMSPLFQVMFVLQNTPDIEDVVMDDITLSPYEYTAETAQFDITLTATETENGISMNVVYNSTLFKKNTIELLLLHYDNLLKNIVNDPTVPIGALEMLTKAEEEQLIHVFNDTAKSFDLDQSVIDVFTDQVEKTPEKTALIFGDTKWSYAALNEASAKLATYLRKRGLQKESKVGILMDRSQEMVISILGILKAGGTFVPIGPEYPQDRINYIVEDAKIAFLLSKSDLITAIENPTVTTVLWDQIAQELMEEEPAQLDMYAPTAASVAYVLYTSGSTGKPKGVMVTHKNLVNFLFGAIDQLEMRNMKTLLSITTYTFDIFYLELFSPLLTGAQVVLIDKEVSANGVALHKQIEKYNADFIQATPSNWKMLVSSGLKYNKGLTMLCCGEAVSDELKNKLLPLCDSLWNLYGPTEATIWATIEELTSDNDVTIGVPLPNYSAYIVDANTNVVPMGVIGELCIGGDSIAKGYLNKKELTERCFIDNPFEKEGKLYFTGDLARWLADGKIEYIGRKDSQVKIRGHRIELGEIENQLAAISTIKEGCVIVQKDHNNDNRLIGYFVSENEAIDAQEIKKELRKKLPDYMVPDVWVSMKELPKNSNGKLDRKSLPDPDISSLYKDAYVAPRTETEKQLVAIWEELLDVERVGIHDNFFELGGHSVLAVQLIAKINHVFSMNLSLASLFEFPTIIELAEKRFSGIDIQDEILVTLNGKGSRKPIFCAPPGGGTVLCYRSLALSLGEEQPFYAFQAPGMDGKTKVLETVEEMASVYISKMQEIDPIGPYRLGGYSFGGEVALEMAIQLQRGGYQIEEIIMFDAIPPHQKDIKLSFEELIAGITVFINKEFNTHTILTLSDLEGKSSEEQLDMLYNIVKMSNLGLTRKQLEAYVAVHKNNINCSYTPQLDEKLRTSIVLFKTEEQVDEEVLKDDGFEKAALLSKNDYGWSAYIDSEVCIHTIPGNHLTLLDPANAILIAGHLDKKVSEEEYETALIS